MNAAVPLQRGLARILLSGGDRKAAIEAYRGILNVQPDSSMDRMALAEIYAQDDMPRAIAELHKLLVRDLRYAPGYQLLTRFYAQVKVRMGTLRRRHTSNSLRVWVSMPLAASSTITAESTAVRVR